MTNEAASVQITLKFAEVSFLLNVAEFGLKSAIARDREQASFVARPFYNLLFAKSRKAEYEPLLHILRNGVTDSKAYGSCEIALTLQQEEVLNFDFQKYRQAIPVSPEQQKAVDKLKTT